MRVITSILALFIFSVILSSNVYAQTIDTGLSKDQNFQNAKTFVLSILRPANNFSVSFFRTHESNEFIACYRTGFKEYENLIGINFENLSAVDSEGMWVFVLAREITRIHMYDEAVERSPELLMFITQRPDLVEYACDQTALEVLLYGGYDPKAAISFYQRYNHIDEPNSAQRIQKIIELINNH